MRKAGISKDKRIILNFEIENREKYFRVLNKIKSIKGSFYSDKNGYWIMPFTKDNYLLLTRLKFSLSKNLEQLHKDRCSESKVEKPIINYKNELLREYQNEHVENMIHVINKINSALDGSDTGTGKTYTSLAIAKHFNKKVIALVPISSISKWEEIAGDFGVKIHALNYEQYRMGKTKYLDRKDYYVTVEKNGEKVKERRTKFDWNTDESHIIIFDEAHRCNNYKTLNGKMLRACLKIKSMVLCLSATISESPLNMYNIGLLLKLFHDWLGYKNWMYKRGVVEGYWGMEFKATQENLKKIHKDLYPSKGNRMRKSEIPGFPKNNIISEAYDMAAAKRIQEIYDNMKGILQITKRIKARQEIELLKVPTMVELTNDLIAQGYSVPVFVNFKETIKLLSEKLKTKCIIQGDMKREDRDKNVDDFQSNKKKIIILNNQAGGESISLHDLIGGHPRVAVINIPESAKGLKQVFGRTVREGTKAEYVTQKLIFCRHTVEEKVADNIRKKINSIDTINDGDLAEEIRL